MQLTEQRRDEIGTQIALLAADAIEDEKISEEQEEALATFVLDNFYTINTQESLIEFLEKLNAQWPYFTNILVLEKGLIKNSSHEEHLQELTEMIKHMQLDDALKKAKKMVSASAPAMKEEK